MRSFLPARSTLGVVVIVAAMLAASVTAGSHAGGDAVGQAALEPTTVYFSQHSSGSDEEHLHAETGFESILCLACFQSLRNPTVLEVLPTLSLPTGLGQRMRLGYSATLLAPRASDCSSRAPPYA